MRRIIFYYVDCGHGCNLCFALTKRHTANTGIGVDFGAETHTSLQVHSNVKIRSKIGNVSPVFMAANKAD
jgi:hypothetical protein